MFMYVMVIPAICEQDFMKDCLQFTCASSNEISTGGGLYNRIRFELDKWSVAFLQKGEIVLHFKNSMGDVALQFRANYNH